MSISLYTQCLQKIATFQYTDKYHPAQYASEFVLNFFLCKKMSFKTFAFFHLETTGLEITSEILELAIIACSVDHFTDTMSPPPRVLHKLNMCFGTNVEIEEHISKQFGL